MFNHIKRSDTGLLLLNLLLLLVIVFIPFPTALLAQQYTAYPDQHLAALIFSGTYVILACCFYLLWNYASYRNRLLGKETDSRAVAAISRQYMFGPLLYLITFGVAFINVPVCIILNFILALFFALPGRSLRLLPKEDENKEDGNGGPRPRQTDFHPCRRNPQRQKEQIRHLLAGVPAC